MPPALTPAQRDVLELLRNGEERPTFAPGLRGEIRARLEREVGPLAGSLAAPLFIGKAALARLHSCEAHHLAEEAAPFSWTVASARGTVAHRAIELWVHRRDEPSPLELVDDALRRLADDPTAPIADFLLGLDEVDRADLRGDVNDLVGKFTESWPRLPRSWIPRTESRLRADLCDGRVVLQGRVDLALGAPEGSRAGRVLVDLKTGRSSPAHLDDLRFYALLETLRTGVPPFRLASYELDAGTCTTEDVGLDVLEVAIRRTVAGVRRAVELRLGLRTAATTPNPACRWCIARATCEGAARWRERTDDDGWSPG